MVEADVNSVQNSPRHFVHSVRMQMGGTSMELNRILLVESTRTCLLFIEKSRLKLSFT